MLLFLPPSSNQTPSCKVTNCKTSFSNICNFFFSLSYIIIIIQLCKLNLCNLSKLLFTAIKSNQLLIHSFHLKCFPWIFSFTLFVSLVLNFIHLWCVCLDPAFSFLSFSSLSWSSFRKESHYFSGHCHKSSWCSSFIVVLGTWRCAGWFCCLTVRSVSDMGGRGGDRNSSSPKMFSFRGKIPVTWNRLFNFLFGKCFAEGFSNNGYSNGNGYSFPSLESIQLLKQAS